MSGRVYPEVSRSHGNVCFQGYSGSRFRAAGGLLVARLGHRDASGGNRALHHDQAKSLTDLVRLAQSLRDNAATRLYDRRKSRPEDSPTFRVSY